MGLFEVKVDKALPIRMQELAENAAIFLPKMVSKRTLITEEDVMSQKMRLPQKPARVSVDEHELLQQEDFQWLAEFRHVLSPYWSSRVEYHPEKKGPVLVLEDARSLK